MSLFPNFKSKTITTETGTTYLKIGGEGPPIVLLHGYPQTHACWHKVAPTLAQHYTVILPDIRGYGRSTLPPNDPTHYANSKRAAAHDINNAMTQLGYDTYALVGHDRGARVGYRLALDHPTKLTKFVSLDVAPTLDTWNAFTAQSAISAYHWPFLAQPHPLPERLIEKEPTYYLEHTLASWTKTKDLTSFHPQALAAYKKYLTTPEAINAYCNDYRAGYHYDQKADQESREANQKIQCPMLVLWGQGPLSQSQQSHQHDMITIWEKWCNNVTGFPINSGHFLAEENPTETLNHLKSFLRLPY